VVGEAERPGRGAARDAAVVGSGRWSWRRRGSGAAGRCGDRYPTTLAGRLAAMFVMVRGIGIIGSLASIMASLLVSPAPDMEASNDGAEATGLELKLERLGAELAGTRDELAALRPLQERPEGDLVPDRPPAMPADGTSNASEPTARYLTIRRRLPRDKPPAGGAEGGAHRRSRAVWRPHGVPGQRVHQAPSEAGRQRRSRQ
jgi:hypothetical protein